MAPNGEILAQGRNRVYPDGDVTWHAEMDVLRQAGPRLLAGPYERGCWLYASVEPCLMCTGALLMTHIARVVWAMDDDLAGAVRCLKDGPYRRQRFVELEVGLPPTRIWRGNSGT
ncbi:MAG: nucleoside deaminase [Bacillota bacterium]